MQKELNLSEIVFPNSGDGRLTYFKAAVLWVLSGENKPTVRRAEKGEKSTFEDPEIIKMISAAVPGQNSYLMDLTIKSNVNEYVISEAKYSLEEKVRRVADSIKTFVVV